jgi:Tol biopolymer transport system component
MNSDWHKVDRLLEAALEREAAQRADFLSEACAGDEALRREVESLLAAHEKAGSFIETSPAEMAAEMLADDRAELAAGQRLGPYKIVARIGSGGMGEVYRAEDTRLDRTLALKILPRDFASDPDRMRRFVLEAKAASAIAHPNVCTIHDVGESEDHRPFIAMECVEGQTLSARIEAGALEAGEVIQIGSQLADALNEAHLKGITHRDIKPANIMLTARGQVKVLDFGLAKMARSGDQLSVGQDPSAARTESGVVLGTVRYMSPEQALGREVDHRTDIFSLGIVMYEMATGRPPFTGASAGETLDRIIHSQPEAIGRFNWGLAAGLERVISKCLEKDRVSRYQSAREILVDLKNLERDGNANFNSTAGRSRFVLETRHVKTVAVATSIAILIVAVVAAGVYRFFRADRFVPGMAFQTMRITNLIKGGKSTDAAISPDGRYVAYALEEAGKQSLLIRQVDTATSLQIVAPAEVDYRGLTFSADGSYVYYVQLGKDDLETALYQIPTLGGSSRKVVTDVGSPITLSPAGDRMAFVRANRGEFRLIVSDVDGTDQKTLATRNLPEVFLKPAWSPDGKVIACSAGFFADADRDSYMNVVEIGVGDGAERPLTPQRWSHVRHLAWLSDGKALVITARDEDRSHQQVWRLAYPSGKAERITNDLNEYQDVSLTADSGALVTVWSTALQSIWAAPDGDVSRARRAPIEPGDYDEISEAAWTTDGRIVFSAGRDGKWDLWTVGFDEAPPKQLTFYPGNNNSPSVSRDGRYVVFNSLQTGSNQVWRIDRDGANPRQLTKGDLDLYPQCSPDGQWVVYVHVVTGKYTLWKVNIDGGEPIKLSDTPIESPAISPDGRLIACVYPDAQLGSIYRIGLIPFEGGKPTTAFDLCEKLNRKTVDHLLPIAWTLDGRGINYVCTRGGVSSIWTQPLDGGSQKQVAAFNVDSIRSLAWSYDGRLAYIRGSELHDVALIKNLSR